MDTEKSVYTKALKKELVPALGCTEPIAIAFAAAKAREVLGDFPTHVDIRCSGNIVKNVKGVTVPNSGGMIGIGAAAVLGIVGGDASRDLEVLEGITPEDIDKTKSLLDTDFFSVSLKEDVDNLYISCIVRNDEHTARVVVVNRHTFISAIEKDGESLLRRRISLKEEYGKWEQWNLKGIIEYAENVDLDEVRDVLDRQIEMNTAIAEEGLSGKYGAEIGKTLLEIDGDSLKTRAKAKAAAGSDARMGGCSLPVVINSGSGNQGMTVSLPVIEYAKAYGCSKEKLYRALLISNLISIYEKHYIGKLSSFCGAVTAASGSGAAITWLRGGNIEQIDNTIVYTLGSVGGIICDGAKASCAAKIASSLDAAITGHELAMRGLAFHSGEGFVDSDIEQTIKNAGYIGRVGMMETDKTILKIMIGEITPE